MTLIRQSAFIVKRILVPELKSSSHLLKTVYSRRRILEICAIIKYLL